jgi:hypothetical protein
MTISNKLNPTSRYSKLNGSQVPWGYNKDKYDKHLLHPVEEQLEALDQAAHYLKESSYNEVARWLTDYTGRKISGMGLWKRIKQDRTDRRRHAEQKRRAAQTEAEGNIKTEAPVT